MVVQYSRGPQLVALADAAGLPLLDYQAQDFTAQLATDPHGKFLHSIVVELCPRRNGKTRKVHKRMAAGALLWNERRQLYTAHLGDTVRECFLDFVTMLQTSGLARYVAPGGIASGKGSEAVTFRNGAVVAFRPRTKKIGRGKEVETLYLDEALELTEEHMGLLTPLRAKASRQGIGQTWVASSAGHGRSVILADLAAAGRAGMNPEVSFTEYAAPRDADPDNPATWAMANPSLGSPYLGREFLAAQRALLDAETFGREHLGWFTDAAGEPFIPPGAWQACRTDTQPGPPAGPPILAVEMQRDRVAAVVAAVPLPAGRVWVEPLETITSPHAMDPADLAALVAAAARGIGAAAVAGDSLTCTGVLAELGRQGWPTITAGAADMRTASTVFLDHVAGRRLLHAYDDAATLEMIGAAGVPTGDNATRISRRASTTDTVRPVATVLAVWALTTNTPRVPVFRTARNADPAGTLNV